MKYTIHGYNQEILLEMGMNNDDALILRYFVDFKESGKMITKLIEGDKYYWLKYKGIIEALPIMNIKKDTVYRKLKNMVKNGILKHQTINNKGSYSFYTTGENYYKLLPYGFKSEGGTDCNPEGYGNESEGGTDCNPDQNINLLINSSNNNSSINNNGDLLNQQEDKEPVNLSDIGDRLRKLVESYPDRDKSGYILKSRYIENHVIKMFQLTEGKLKGSAGAPLPAVPIDELEAVIHAYVQEYTRTGNRMKHLDNLLLDLPPLESLQPVQKSNGPTPEEIAEMKRQAEEFEEYCRKKREESDTHPGGNVGDILAEWMGTE